MRTFVVVLIAAMCPALAAEQAPQAGATLRVTVVDPSGGVIVGARVTLRALASSQPVSPPVPEIGPLETGGRGDATFTALGAGRYTVHVESPGFEPADVRDVRVRPGENRREVKLAIARLAETIQVGRDSRERGSDPRSDAFATVLGANEISELPDDPDEMQRVLEDLAGPGAVIRVNGFRGGKLPPKDQIAQIRFHRNMFAADAHDPGFISVDIVTKPGLENWRGSTNIGWRDSVLNARNAFAPVKGDERNQRYAFSLNGPLWRKHTSLALSVDGVDAYDSKTIVAALPSGYFADSIRRPNATANVSVRLEHALGSTQMLRVEAQRNHNRLDNQGAGDFDLAERGYRQTRDEDLFRASVAGSIRKSIYNELRVQRRSQNTSYDASSDAPAVMVLNAFNSGGAQIGGALNATDVEIGDDLDIAAGKHAWRAGFLIEGGQYRSDVRRNATGTFTFSSLDAFAAGRPTTFTQNVGDPHVDVSQWQAGFYVQDDYRVLKALTISGGVREESQQHTSGLHIGPRGGIAWSPFQNGKTTVRAGGGVFFDWFDAQSYEQAVQLDGSHQQVSTVVSPGYPNALSGGQALLLPSGRVALASDLTLPVLKETSVAVERLLPRDFRVNVMLVRRRGSHGLRGININAPLADRRRPDPTAGTITEVESIAESSFDGMFVNLNFMRPEKRIFVGLNYGLSRTINESDGPFGLPADSRNLAAERGPGAMDARHRFTSLANLPVYRKLMAGTAVRVQSALPYNVTTGFDDNGDTVSNDRPAGVTRNSGRGRVLVDVGTRLSWTIGFGGAARPGPGGPRAVIIRGDNADPLGSIPTPDGTSARYRLELYAQGYNLLNHTNALNFSGVMTSPFFGQATSALAPRRLEIGTRIMF